MIIILDQIIVTKEVKDKVVTYLSKPREVLDAHNPGTFKLNKFDDGCFFRSTLFHSRVMEAMEAWDSLGTTVREESIIVTPEIPTYVDEGCDTDDQWMSLHFIVTEDNQIIIISIDDKIDDMDETHWMGIAYFGEESVFCNLLDELGIDINKALNLETL